MCDKLIIDGRGRDCVGAATSDSEGDCRTHESHISVHGRKHLEGKGVNVSR
jgi:hypothetical protein